LDASEILEVRELIERDYTGLEIEQDLGLGMMLWLSHFFRKNLGRLQTNRCLTTLDQL
jgi:hypothetical protein